MSLSFTPEQKQTAVWVAVALAFLILLTLLAQVIMPFVVAGILAYILNPLVDKLAHLRIGRYQFPRSAAASIGLLLLTALICLLFATIVPIFQKEIPQLQEQIPRFFDKTNDVIGPFLQKFGIKVRLDSVGIKAVLNKQFASGGDAMGHALLSSIRVGGIAVLGIVANLLLIPIVLYYLLMDWHAMLSRLQAYVPRRWVKGLVDGIHEVDELMAQYLRGQLLLMFTLSVFYSVGLTLSGFDLALPIGIITGILVFVPYLGFGLGLVLALIAAFLQFSDWSGFIAVAVVYGIGQVLESFYLTPRMVGERIGLHPITVIFALLAFGELLGFVGILLALPLSAIISVVMRYVRRSYFKSSFYHQS